MDEETKRNQRGDLPTGSTDQKGKAGSFVQNGLEHFNYKNPATIVTFGIVGFVFLIISTTLIGYRNGRTEVKQIISETVLDVPLDKDFSIRSKFKSIDESNIYTKIQLQSCQNELGKMEDRVNFLESFQQAPTRRKR